MLRDFLTTLRESNSSRCLDEDASTVYNALRDCGLFLIHDVSLSSVQVRFSFIVEHGYLSFFAGQDDRVVQDRGC